MFRETDGLSPYSCLTQVHRGCREGEEKDSDRKSKGSQKEAGCSLASLGELIHQTTFLWQQMKRKKIQRCSPCSGHILFLGHGWINYRTSHSARWKQGVKVFVTEEGMPASSLTSVINQSINHPPFVCSCWSLRSIHCWALQLGQSLKQGLMDKGGPIHTRTLVWGLTGGPSPNFRPSPNFIILWSPTSITPGTLGPWASSAPSQVASSPQHPLLTKSGRGNCVDIYLLVADLLVALPVGRWLGQDRALIAVAPRDFVHTLDHTWLEALPTGWGALEERRHWDMVQAE